MNTRISELIRFRPQTMGGSVSIPAATPSVALRRIRSRALRFRGELGLLIVLAGTPNLWALSRNGWANDYYAAAVRSMSTSWHDFLFASLDHSGVMTVDKPPLALWVQALSVRIFGFHSLSILVPQALEGVASVALLYDIVRRRFGRLGGFVGGLVFALSPITLAISRHNNPDALLVLCCVAALWFALRGMENGRTRELIFAGVAVGLGFETKMLLAFVVVPGIAAAWMWVSERGRLAALGQLLAGGAAMTLVAGAWPLLVELTPAANRPWISGTSDNTILSLIFGYNGLGRVDGQAGGPGGAVSNMFGGAAGPLRLLNSALGGQIGWLLGFGLVSFVGIVLATRLRRRDARSGWIIAVGGAFAVTAVLFSEASGIFHPYYVSLLSPFLAALCGAGAAQLIAGELNARLVGVAAIAAAVATELIVLNDYTGQLSWLPVVLIIVGVLTILGLIVFVSARARTLVIAGALTCLMIAPASWAFDTLGYATSSTFPSGGPQSAQAGGFGGPPGVQRGTRFAPRGAAPGAIQLFGNGSQSAAAPAGGSAAPPGPGGSPPGIGGAGGGRAPGGAGGFGGPFGGDAQISQILSYVKAHGGATIAVSSQTAAAQAIISKDAHVAGIGGFSGRESDVSVSWLAHEVSSGQIRWVLDEQSTSSAGPRLPGDNRAGSRAAMSAVQRACTAVTLTSTTQASSGSAQATLYDCQGRAGALLNDSA
ncbi:MAG TPA: glycosyltransferase family 39 protein [Solirubrobacteraceae bacterium]